MIVLNTSIGYRRGRRILHHFFSTAKTSPLLLSLASSEPPYDQVPKILHPRDQNTVIVESLDDVCNAVDNYYGLDESDVKSVWFTSSENGDDPLRQFYSIIEPSIHDLKGKNKHEHIQYGIYTSGTVSPKKMADLAVFSKIQVSLLAANPIDYCEAAGVFREEMFGDVCNFLVDAQETQALKNKMEVGLLKKYAADGKELATEFGISDVHVYP